MHRLRNLWAAWPHRPSGRQRLAVFIDGDGVSPKDAGRALDWLEHRGRISVLRCYGNYTGSAASAWTGLIKRRGIVARHLPSVSPGKNATDIALSIDAMELLLMRPIDVFVLIVSDTDFVPLVHRIREEGKSIIGIGQRSTAEPFRRACTEFHDIRMLGRDKSSTQGDAKLWSSTPSDAEALVLGVLAQVDESDRPISLSELGMRLVQRDPTFDARVYGRRTLRSLLSAMADVELVEDEGQWHASVRNQG